MKIGIDISQIVYEGTGVARYTNGLIREILRNHDHEWVFFFSSLRQKLDDLVKQQIRNKNYKLITTYLPPTVLSFLWNDLHIFPIERFTGNLDWFITSDWTEPPSSMKKATIIHDLMYLVHPDTLHPKIISTQRKRMEWVKKESKIIFCVSESTKQDCIQKLGIESQRLVTVYNGVTVIQPSESDLSMIQKKYNLPKQFILTVGKIEPRKNIERLIQAFQMIKNTNLELIIVGEKGWGNLKHEENSKIRFLGYVPDRDLYALYASCLFFVYPSLYEGFGYPVAEAMKLGVPVATSNTSSLKEISDNNALLFDPNSTEDIADKIQTLITDQVLRNELAVKGKQNAKRFSWKNCLEQILYNLNNK